MSKKFYVKALSLILVFIFSFSFFSVNAAAISTEDDDEYTLINLQTGEELVIPNAARAGATSTVPPDEIQQQATLVDMFGSEISPASVISPDARYQITNITAPYKAIAYLTLYFNGYTTYATGFFVKTNILLTAAHNIENLYYGDVVSINIKPGGVNSSITSETVSGANVYVPSGWNGYDSDYDYAIIVMPDHDLGTLAGTLNLQAYSSSSLTGTSINVIGYPGDKAAGTLWAATGTVQSYGTYRLWHNVDTYSGQSGSPVSLMANTYTVIGIDTNGFLSSDSYQYNSSTRINSTIIDMVNYLYSAGVGGIPDV